MPLVRSIMIVDEDASRTLALVRSLQESGHLPIAFERSDRALSALLDEGEAPDLILVADTESMSGRSFASALARDPMCREIPVVHLAPSDGRSDAFVAALEAPIVEASLMTVIARFT